MKANRFSKGSGVYTCRCCDHRTRDTGGDGASVQLCDICYELAGYENMMMDGAEFTANHKLAILNNMIALAKRNGDEVDCWDELLEAIR